MPGAVDAVDKGLEKARGGPEQDAEGRDADAPASLLQAVYEGPDKFLLGFAQRGGLIEERDDFLGAEKIRAERQAEREEREDGKKRVIGKGSRSVPGHSEVWFVAWDRPALLARIAGAFLSAELNILSADVFTRGDSLALDIFRVHTAKLRPVENRRDQERVAKVLSESLHAEHFDFHTLITGKPRSALRGYRLSQEFELPTKIRIDNDSHPFCTLVEVQTPDRLGLLYDLLNALGACGVNIETSRITTEMDVAMDTFYVTGKEGGKIVADQAIERLQKQLRAAAVRS